MHARPTGSVHNEEYETASNPLSSSTKEELPRRTKRERKPPVNSNDFRVKIPEFEGKLDPDEFLEWIQMVEHIFEYKEVLKDKKVQLVAFKLRKYVSVLVDELMC